MSEWWTYRPSSFLMFAPRTYWRLVELYQREVWPLQWLLLAAGLLLIWLASRRRARDVAAVCVALAVIWLWVGWAFHWQRYATINWGARYFAIAFAIEAIALLGLGRADARAPRHGSRTLGLVIAAFALGGYPMLAGLAGRPWSQGEWFGLMPEPTALATVGLLLAARPARRGWLLLIPVLSLALGFTTLWLISR